MSKSALPSGNWGSDRRIWFSFWTLENVGFLRRRRSFDLKLQFSFRTRVMNISFALMFLCSLFVLLAIPAIWTLPGSHLWEVFLPGWSPSRQKWGSAPREERWTRVQARWTRPSWRKAPPPSSSHPSCRCPLSLERHHCRIFGSLL